MSPIAYLPIALALLAEAAWTSIVAGLLQLFVLQDPGVGLAAMLLAAVGGWVAARRLAPRLGDRWPTAAGAIAAGLAGLAVLADAEVLGVLATGGPVSIPDALAANPAGLMVGVAFLRGVAHAHMPPDPRPIATALAIGTPLIAVAAIVGGAVTEPWRSQYLASATVDVVVFLVAGLGALTLSRLTTVGTGSGTGIDWRRNPPWMALLIALLGGILLASVLASAVAGPIVVAVIGALIPAFLVLGLVFGIDRRSLRVTLIVVAVMLGIAQLFRLLGGNRPAIPSPVTPGVPGTPNPGFPAPLAIGLIALVVGLAVLGAIVLVRIWMGRSRAGLDDLDEERWIDHGEVGETARTRRRRGLRLGRSAPADAVAAYRALLEAIDGRPGVGREPGETPAEHAGRLREAGVGTLALDLLAADYALARFGARDLTATEDRRAIGRGAALRRHLLAAPVAAPADGETETEAANDMTRNVPDTNLPFRMG
jgi:multisubunit Na+/H+ antiporter MnhC subunit